MAKKYVHELTGVIVRDNQLISITELCHCCKIKPEDVKQMVEHGIIEPSKFQENISHWQFSFTYLIRVQTVLRLQQDLGVNLPGAALALDLLDEIKLLRRLSNTVE